MKKVTRKKKIEEVLTGRELDIYMHNLPIYKREVKRLKLMSKELGVDIQLLATIKVILNLS